MNGSTTMNLDETIKFAQNMRRHFETHNRVQHYPCHTNMVHSVDWNCDGRKLASGVLTLFFPSTNTKIIEIIFKFEVTNSFFGDQEVSTRRWRCFHWRRTSWFESTRWKGTLIRSISCAGFLSRHINYVPHHWIEPFDYGTVGRASRRLWYRPKERTLTFACHRTGEPLQSATKRTLSRWSTYELAAFGRNTHLSSKWTSSVGITTRPRYSWRRAVATCTCSTGRPCSRWLVCTLIPPLAFALNSTQPVVTLLLDRLTLTSAFGTHTSWLASERSAGD